MSNLEKTNKLYGTNNGGEPVVPVVDGLTQMSSKMSTLNSTDPGFLVDAFNIDWSSGKYYFNDEQIFSTGQLIEEINKKATTSDWGGNIEDLRSSTYISVQINIYKAFNEKQTNLSAPTFASGVDADHPSSNPPTDWSVSIDTISEGQYVYMSSCYKVVDLNNTLKGYCGPCSTPIFLPSENGLNGNFKSIVFTRTNTTPAAPADCAYYSTGLPADTRVYDASNNQQISGKLWSDGIPEGKEIVWASSAIISDDNGNFDTTAVWSIPRQMTDTDTYDVEFSPYSNATNTAPMINPSTNDDDTGNRHMAPAAKHYWFDLTLDATIPNGVHKVTDDGQIDDTNGSPVTWEKMIWRAERECINGVWSNWTISRVRGERGEGVSGPFVSTVFTRTNKDISSLNISETVTAGQYNEYAHPIPPSQTYDGETIEWTDGTPEGPGALWSAWKTFSLTTDNGEWSSPHLMADTDTYDVEFSPSVTKPNDPSTDPSNWIDPTTNHYKDYTEQNQHIYEGSWEDMIWRAERTKNPGDEWTNQPWVITRIKGEKGEIQKPADYYQSRYAKINKTSLDTNDKLTNQTGNNGPSTEYIDASENVSWYKYVPSSGTGNVWQTMRRVTWQKDNNTWVELYDPNSSWEEPFMLNGLPGEAQPIHPCLLYKWALNPTSSNNYSPTVNLATNGIPSGWEESPGSPSDTTNIFLWMIQGEYKIDGNSRVYQKINGDNYWTTPICLSGADGKPGEDGDDIEFIYKSFQNATSFDGTTDDSPQHWYTTNIEVDYAGTGSNAKAKPDYLGPTGKEWSDNASAQVISPSNRYVYCSYRRSVKSGNTRYWTPFSPPFPWSIWGENGIDGDGVEYIYWICNEYPVQSAHEWNTNDFNPHSWDLNATNGKDGKDFQDDDYLGPNNQNNKWTDEPTGVSLNGKYEYVSTRKKIQDPNDPKKKIWDRFSKPSLWSNFAEDGVATNMVLETDNDNVTVGIDGDGLVNNDYSTSSNIYLRYNGISQSAYDLSLDITILLNKINSSSPLYNKLSCTNSNRNLHWNNGTTNGVDLISINNSTKTISIVIPKNFPIGAINNLMEVQLCATTNAAIGDVQSGEDYTRIFTVSGVELSIEDIYQIGLNTTTPHRNANNDGFDSIQLWLSSFTSTNIINNVNDAAAANMFVTYYSTNKNTSAPTGSPNSTQLGYLTNFNVTLNPYYNKHIFVAYYNSDVSSINDVNIGLVDSTHINNKSTKFLDSEEATAVYDGTNGVDSRSEEYIYLLTDDIDFLTNKNNEGDNYYIPSSWHETGTSANYQNDDYPFLAGSPTINGIKYVTSITIDGNNNSHDGTIITNDKVINIWTDNPQGVSEEYPYEFRALRKYKTTNADGQRWLAFENPVIWANWGHTGEDGDGVEYIYYLCDEENKQFDETNNPQYWYDDLGFQGPEYFRPGTSWTDNPSSVDPNNKYEYVSVRKYTNNNRTTNDYEFTDVYECSYWTGKTTEGTLEEHTLTTNPSIVLDSWKTSGTIINHNYDANESTTDINNIGQNNITAADNLYALLKQLTLEYIAHVNNNGITSKYSIYGRHTYSENLYENYIMSTTIPSADILCIVALCAEYGHRQNSNISCLSSAGSGDNVYSQIGWIMQPETGDQNIISEIGRIYNILLQHGIILQAKYAGCGLNSSGNPTYNRRFWAENTAIETTTSSSKQWQPYSEPTLWAKYGETGPQGPGGQPGSSGLTIDFDNPSLQIAVNSNGLIKDNQEISTRIRVYSGETDISSNITGVQITSITNNGKTHILTKAYNSNGGGYTLAKDNNIWKYTFKVLDNDVDNGADIDETEPWQQNTDYFINSNIELEFTITYNGNEYIKHITAIPIKYGEDGQDAELFELSSETSVIRYDAKSDNLDYEPSYVEYNIHHVRGNNDETQYINEIVSYTDINEYLNNGTLKLYYHLDTEGGIQQQEGGTIVVGDQTRPVPGTNSTTLFADTNTSLSGSGLYTTEGASLGGTKTDTTSTSQFVTDVNTIQADSVVVVPVREVELERNTAEETLLTYLDNSLNWTSMFNSYVGTNSQNTSSGSGSGSSGGLGGLTPIIKPTSKYDETNIASVAQALNDYADYLEALSTESTVVRSNYSIEDVRNTADIVSNVASSLGEITTAKDGSQSWALSNEASIYVNDVIAQQDSEINTSIHSKVSALEIQQKRDDLVQAQTIRDDLVQQGTASEYYNNYASSEYTRIASATIDETWKILTMSNNDEDITFKLDINNLIKNRQNWTPSSNGAVVNTSIINENISGTVTLIRIRLVYDNSETLTVWDEDSLEIVYDGVDGVDSDVLEYIYYCPAYTSQKTWDTTGGNESENPARWTASNSADYFPEGNTYIDDGTNGGWADHPHGVDSEHPYEYYSIRTKDGATGQWSVYDPPVVWSHYGETGRDGDGVEYIFARTTTDSVTPSKPSITSWDQFKAAQSTEWGVGKTTNKTSPNDTTWSDNSQSVNDSLKTQWVCIRKYKQITDSNKQNLVTTTTQVNTTEEGLLYLGNNTSSKLCKADGTQLKIGDYAWFAFSVPSIWSRNIKGDTGNDAISLDWTNDQINLAVKSDTTINNTAKQYKSTTLYIYNSTSNVSNVTVSSSLSTSTAISIGNSGSSINNQLDTSKIRLYVDYYTNYIKCAVETVKNSCIATIPEIGIDLSFDVTFADSTTRQTTLRICGQHNGENAVTYEINPSANSIKKSGTTFTPLSLSYTLIKYNGENISQVSNWPTGLSTRWMNLESGASISSNNSSISFLAPPFNNLTKGINLELVDSNNVVIDRETIPIVADGNTGQNATQYEIIPSSSAIIKTSSTVFDPMSISLKILKHNGNTISSLTPSNGLIDSSKAVSYTCAGNNTKYLYKGPISLNNCVGGNPATGSLTCYVHNTRYTSDTVISSITIPIVPEGPQGLTGPVVRMRGEFNSSYYYSDGAVSNDYVESDGIRYIDIVYYYGKYWKCNVHKNFDNTDSTTDHGGVAKHTGYVNGTYFNVSNGVVTSGVVTNNETEAANNYWDTALWNEQKGKPYWIEATQFDFVATKLLYADQALINQISTHDLIATDSNNKPVAGVTGGAKHSDAHNVETTLDNIMGSTTVHYSENGNNTQNDPSNVRIFAGEIYDTTQNSYSLTYAPFNVRQDGTAYMSKANIVGNVNIGGTVDISGNVHIHGNNVKIDGDLYANTLALSSNSFYYNELKMLPDFNEGERIEHHIMFYGADSSITYIVPQPNTYLLAITGSNSTLTNTQYGGDSLYVNDKALYTLYSGFGALPTNQSINGKFWLVTKTDLFVVPSANVPASISTRISATISVTSIVRGVIVVQVSRGATPSVTKQYDGRNYTFNHLANWSYTIQFDRPTYWRQKINGKYFRPGENNNPDVIVEDDLIIGETNHDYQYATGYGNEGQSVSVSTINLRACAAAQVPNDQNGGVMAYKINTQNGNYYDNNYNDSWYNISGSNATSIIENHLEITATCILTRS